MAATAQSSREAAIPASLTSDEIALLAQLRSKYACSSASTQGEGAGTLDSRCRLACRSTPPTAGRRQHAGSGAAPAPVPPARTTDCRMCIGCQGSGKEFDIYDHRRLERPCPDCGGEGVRGGSASQLAEPSGGGRSSESSSSGGSAARLLAYEQELAGLKQSLAGCRDEQELQLRAELILQLERQVLRLQQQQAPGQLQHC